MGTNPELPRGFHKEFPVHFLSWLPALCINNVNDLWYFKIPRVVDERVMKSYFVGIVTSFLVPLRPFVGLC